MVPTAPVAWPSYSGPMSVPSAPEPLGVAGSHRLRTVAEGFGADADRYDRARPHYPAALAETILAGLPGRDGLPGRRVLDVGIGTGISALPFRDAGATVFGVEPDARMAAIARKRGFEVEQATFETWDPSGRSFDAVIAGQAWHWIDPVSGAQKAAEVLPAGGRLALFWNVGDPPADLAAVFAESYRQADTGLPFTPWAVPQRDGYGAFLDKAADGIDRAGGFGTPERLRLDWQQTMTKDDFLEQVPTAGGHQLIAPEKLERLLASLGAAIDAVGGSFTMDYATLALIATRN